MKEKNISNFLLEQYILKELPEDKIREIDNICIERPDILERVEEIKKSNADILGKYPAGQMVENIMSAYGKSSAGNKRKFLFAFRLDAGNETGNKKIKNINEGKKKRIYRSLLLSSAGLAAAAVLVFNLMPVNTDQYSVSEVIKGTDRIKGNNSPDMSLYIYRKNNNTIDDLKDGSLVKKGDLLQVAYLSKKDKYGIILSIDGRGMVTLHYPSGDGSTALSTGKKVPLASAYQLDDAPVFERFFLVTSETALNVKEVMDAARSVSKDKEMVFSGNIRLVNDPDGLVKQVSINLIKDSLK